MSLKNIFSFKEEIGVFEGNSEFNQSVIKDLYDLRYDDSSSDKGSNVKGWQKNILDYIEFKDIQNMILQEFVEYFQTTVGELDMNARMVKLFANINPPGAFNVMHHHTGGHFSGAYWLQAHPNSGNIIFMNPLPSMFMNTFEQNTISKSTEGYQNYNCIEIKPLENLGCFFSNNLVHYVDVNRSNIDRISLAFHIKLEDN